MIIGMMYSKGTLTRRAVGGAPPQSEFMFKPVIFETTSERGASAAEWWTGITKLEKSK